jgi:hypothetical protein
MLVCKVTSVHDATPRTVVIHRRRQEETEVIAQLPFDPARPPDIMALAREADLEPGDMVRVEIVPPFHAVTDAPPREIEIRWPVSEERLEIIVGRAAPPR